MSDHPNAARYREMSAAVSDGDLEAFAGAVADDVTWWEIGAGEPIRGKQALLERFQSLSDFEISADLHDVVANDDHLIALLHATARRGGDTLSYRVAEIYHVNAAGQVTERWAFSDDTQVITDFFT